MKNLLNACFARIFKSKIFYIGLISSLSLSVIISFFVNSSSGNISTVVTLTLMILPMIIAAFVGLCIDPEFSHGTIRNKLIVGHKREQIYLAFLISLSAVSLIYYAVYLLGAFTVGLGILGIKGLSLKATITVIVLMAILYITSTAISLLICIIIHGGKCLALVLIFQYAMLFVGVLGESGDNKILSIFARCIPQGQFSLLDLYTMPDKPLFTAICSISLFVVVTMLSVYSFKSSDIK